MFTRGALSVEPLLSMADPTGATDAEVKTSCHAAHDLFVSVNLWAASNSITI
jgi:hypothetical protein